MSEFREVAKYAGRTSLSYWIDGAREVHPIAVALAGTSFVPKSMQQRPNEVIGAILAGQEIGLGPMAALRAIDIIEGTPALRALALRALVQSHGHEIEVTESSETRAVVRGRRKGASAWQTSTWTMDRARKAGLASKRNWTTNPTAMLIARATGECCRMVAADAILGMPYAAEELSDGVAPPGDEAAPPETVPKRRLARRALPDVEAPALEPAPATVPYSEVRYRTVDGPSLDEVRALPQHAEPAEELAEGRREDWPEVTPVGDE